jgi:hypothetical protein
MMVYGELGGSSFGDIPETKKEKITINCRRDIWCSDQKDSNRKLSEDKSGAIWSEKN